MKKALNVFTIILAVAALALMGRAGYRFYRFSSEYTQVWNVEIDLEEIEQLEAERDTAALMERITQREQEIAAAGMAADRDLIAYRVGTIHGYSNRGDIVMFLEEDNPYDMSTWEYRFYDQEGNPLYLEEHQGKGIVFGRRGGSLSGGDGVFPDAGGL